MKHPVYVVDDERESRIRAAALLQSWGLETRPFLSGEDFLGSLAELRPGPVLVRLASDSPRTLHFLSALRERRLGWPVVALADELGVAEAVAAMKLGASDIVEKPVEAGVLKDALAAAGEALEAGLVAAKRVQRSRALIEALSARELEVLRALLAGHSNKRAAELCGISVRTVEMHRAKLVERLGGGTFVGAVRIALEAGVEPLQLDAA